MGNVNTLRNQKSAVHQKKEYVLNDIQLKIQQNLNKQKKSVNSQLKTSQTRIECPLNTNRIQCQSGRSLLEDQPILFYR